MAVCVDITLYCDKCLGNELMDSSITKVRQEAKKQKWQRKRNKQGEMQDICPECKRNK